MSRQATIKKLIEKGKLFRHESLYFGEAGIPQEDAARTLFVSHDIDAAVAFPFADTTPGIRSFGAFSDRDEFVALTWMMREDIEAFDEEVQSAIEAWKNHFGSEGPHEGDDIHEYLTICLPV
jgi:hypothetical protein